MLLNVPRMLEMASFFLFVPVGGAGVEGDKVFS